MNILLIDPFPQTMRDQLSALGHPLRYMPDARPEEVLATLGDVDILVMNSKLNADVRLLEAAPNLKMVCRAGVGMDHFDLPLLAAKGILAVNTPGANAISVGEQAVGTLLSLMHHIARADRQVRQFQWKREENRGTELYGKTVGIIGYGNTGSACGRNLSGFGCKVLAYDKYKSGFAPPHVEECRLEQIFEEADILSLHVPLTPETKGWVDAEFLAQFRKPIWLLNLARGPIVPMGGLLVALEQGNVIAAGLDVLENENMATLAPTQKSQMQALMATDRVIFTPHIGGWSHESLDRINAGIVAEIARFLNSQ